MYSKLVKFCILLVVIIALSACETANNSNVNLINKVNSINDRWINYKGISENNKSMIQSQFISYDFNYDYEITHDAYVSYFNGDTFIKTKLYENTPETIDAVEEADGIILSFNKENKSGMKLTKIN